MRHLKLIVLGALTVLVLAAPASASARHRDRNHDRIPDRWEKTHKLSLRVNQARRDQDHLPLLIRAVPQIADRAASILEGAPSPEPQLVSGAQWLQASGAALVVMPCNTAHLWHASIQQALQVPMLHIVDAADPVFRAQMQVTREVLEEIGAGDVPWLLVLNKIDKVAQTEREELLKEFPAALIVA